MEEKDVETKDSRFRNLKEKIKRIWKKLDKKKINISYVIFLISIFYV